MKLFYSSIVTISLVVFSSCTKDIGTNPDLQPKPLGACDTITFAKHVAPIFTNQCATCHFTGGQSPELIDYTTIKAQVDGGRIQARVIDQVPSAMPLGGSLSTSDLDMLKCWLNAGAPNN